MRRGGQKNGDILISILREHAHVPERAPRASDAENRRSTIEQTQGLTNRLPLATSPTDCGDEHGTTSSISIHGIVGISMDASVRTQHRRLLGAGWCPSGCNPESQTTPHSFPARLAAQFRVEGLRTRNVGGECWSSRKGMVTAAPRLRGLSCIQKRL